MYNQTPGVDVASIRVNLSGDGVLIDAAGFRILLDSSVASNRAGYLRALNTSSIDFSDLVELADIANIPYPLFFARREHIEWQVANKTQVLLAGISKDVFSLNSRTTLRLSDVELIVRDLLRKQQLLKRLDSSLKENVIVGSLQKSKAGVVSDAAELRRSLGLGVGDLRVAKNKEKALAVLIDRCESAQILVSISQQNFMPQRIPNGVKFSGLCVRDKKIPYIFLASGDDDGFGEPHGRRILTLTLLIVMVARAKFAAVSYSDQTAGLITATEYRLAEEILMPSEEIESLNVASLDLVRDHAETYRVTPSAFVMRAQRAGLLTKPAARRYLQILATQYAARAKPTMRNSLPVNAIRKYNGVEFSRRMLSQLDAGRLSQGEFCRVVFLNKLGRSDIAEYRAAL